MKGKFNHKCIRIVLTLCILINAVFGFIGMEPVTSYAMSNVQVWETTSMPNKSFVDLEYANGTYVALAIASSTPYVSTDGGITWTNDTMVGTYCYDVSYANGLFILACGAGKLFTSTDGLTWTSRTTGTTKDLHSCMYVDGQYRVYGYNGTLVTSNDGETWTAGNINANYDLGDIAYGNGQYIATRSQGGATNEIYCSTDGLTWTIRNPGLTNSVKSVAFKNGRFVIVGYNGWVRYSDDGINWTAGTSGVSSILTSVAADSKYFVAVGYDGTIVTSTDGATWTKQDSGTTNPIDVVRYVNGTFHAVAFTKMICAERLISKMILSTTDTIATTGKAISVDAYIDDTTFSGQDESGVCSALFDITYDNSVFEISNDESGYQLGADVPASWSVMNWDTTSSPGHILVSLGDPSFNDTIITKKSQKHVLKLKFNVKQDAVPGDYNFNFNTDKMMTYLTTAEGNNVAGDGEGTAQVPSTYKNTKVKVVNTYMISFNKNQGDTEVSPASIKVADGSTISTLPDPPTRKYWVFKGWNTQADGNGSGFTSSTTVTSSYEVFAKWERETYKITFDKNQGDTDANPSEITVNSESTVATLPDAPTREHYTFKEWNRQADGQGAPFTTSTAVTGAATVYAQWTPNNYTITFDKNLGDTEASPASITAPYLSKIETFPVPPSRAGFDFKGWNSQADGQGAPFTTSTAITGAAVVFADWGSQITSLVTNPGANFRLDKYNEQTYGGTDTSCPAIRFNAYMSTSVSYFKPQFTAINGSFKIFDLSGTDKTNSGTFPVGTGCKVKLYNNLSALVKEYTVVLIGDGNSDGYVLMNDVVLLRSIASGKTSVSTLTPSAKFAIDMKRDGILMMNDAVLLQKAVLNDSIDQSK